MHSSTSSNKSSVTYSISSELFIVVLVRDEYLTCINDILLKKFILEFPDTECNFFVYKLLHDAKI